jgi:hypothetical protein
MVRAYKIWEGAGRSSFQVNEETRFQGYQESVEMEAQRTEEATKGLR